MLAMPNPSSGRLSRLQEFILTAAYRNHVAEHHVGEHHRRNGGKPEMDLYNAEVFAAHFGLPVKQFAGQWIRVAEVTQCKQAPAGQSITLAEVAQRIRENPGNQWFERSVIGTERYAAAQASLSRAVRRLEARGLVTSHQGSDSRWAGVRLTGDGMTLAADLDSGRPPSDR